MNRKVAFFRISFIVLWLLFTWTLCGWWWYHGLKNAVHFNTQTETQNEAQNEIQNEIEDKTQTKTQSVESIYRMFFWEGGTLFSLLLIGGSALLYFAIVDLRRNHQLQEFYANFNHDLKTSLAALRLQAEALQDDELLQKNPELAKPLQRIKRQSVRLELQLENSLLFANQEVQTLYLEQVELSKFIEQLSIKWVDLQFKYNQDATLLVDQRSLNSILNNICQNALVHGKATCLEFIVSQPLPHQILLQIADNGVGFLGDIKTLGQPFAPSLNGKGSGMGLYLAKQLMAKMQKRIQNKVRNKMRNQTRGEIQFVQNNIGFEIRLFLSGNLLEKTIEKTSGEALEKTVEKASSKANV